LDVGSETDRWGDDKVSAAGAAKDVGKVVQTLVGEVRETGIVPYSELFQI